jgi:signal transduction histidine kinase
MSPGRSIVGLEEIQHIELARLARFMVYARQARGPFLVVPFVVIALLRPNAPRIAVLFVCLCVLVALGWWDNRRYLRDGYQPSFLLVNALLISLVHVVLLLTTGALASPLVPVIVVFSAVVGILLGNGSGRRRFLTFQCACVVGLGVVQALGWADALAPTWLAPQPGVARAALGAGMVIVLLGAASRIGSRVRWLFDGMLTRTVEARQDLLRAHQEQAEELTALSASIAHELKNPLASVKGLAGLLARGLTGKEAEHLAVLRREVDRMQGILEEFLNFSRPAVPLSITDVDLAALCADVARLHEGLAHDKGVRLSLAGEGYARLDARKMRQVLMNLVQNAIDASPASTEVLLRLHQADGATCIDVVDAGAGLDPAVRDRLFTPGVTTKPTGSGLGLTIARALARQQGGDVELESTGTGCRARIRMPPLPTPTEAA